MSEGLTAEGRVEIEYDRRNPEKDIFKEVDLRARAHMSKDAKLSYRQACYAAWLADPDLHRAYLKATPPIDPRGGK